jgi:hypothetical protein
MNDKLYDVVAVNLETNKVRIYGYEQDTRERADAIVQMAVARRGLETEFFSEVIHGQYSEGDEWNGSGDIKPYEPETRGDPPRIQKIGNMWYPIGPRGLDR